MSSNSTETKSNNPFDIFIVGTKKGLNIGLYSLLPNVLMAFVLTYMLQLFGVMKFLGENFGGIMGVFDLPGEALSVLLATWLSCGRRRCGEPCRERLAQRSRRYDSRARLHSDGFADPVHGSPSRRCELPEEVLARADAQQRPHGLHRHDPHALLRLIDRSTTAGLFGGRRDFFQGFSS